MKMREFRYGTFTITTHEDYYQFLSEVFVVDVYRSDLLKQNSVVLDLGAGVGEFSILASKKVGDKGKVIAIEPNPADFELLKSNIELNYCKNIIPLNLGVGNQPDEKEITFWGRKFNCKIDVLENIFYRLSLKDKVNFVKMDIEGFETDVVSKSIQIVKEANVISVECHGTKEKLDELLLPHGFYFKPIDYRYCYKKMLKNLVFHPAHFYKTSIAIMRNNPQSGCRQPTSSDLYKTHVFNTGTYMKGTNASCRSSISL
jgi:SAM-dependent methyltransferase